MVCFSAFIYSGRKRASTIIFKIELLNLNQNEMLIRTWFKYPMAT